MASRLRYGPQRWVTVFGSHRILVSCHDYRAFLIDQQSGTQQATVAVWKRLENCRPALCIDVGANYGEFSSIAAGLGLRLIIVEASPVLVPYLQTSFAGLTHVTILHAAASDEDGSQPFYFNREVSGSASLADAVPREDPNAPIGSSIESQIVPVLRLDTIVSRIVGEKPTSILMKIDVEGFEAAVLRGALSLLEGIEGWRAILEFNPDAMRKAGDDPDKFWNFLRRWNGVVLDEDPKLRDSKLSELQVFEQFKEPLPEAAPQRWVNVVIGEGRFSG
jgi:FkbM family methyltransferase